MFIKISRPYNMCVMLAAVYLGWVWWAFGTPLAWVTLGEAATALSLPTFSDEGYDGQFTYFIAREPLGAADFIDVPAYRYQRILLPILGWMLSIGYPPLIPFALVTVNLAALGISIWLLEELLTSHGVSRWYALGYGLSLGVLGTVRLALPEVLAYGLCIGGIWFIQRHKLWWAILVFALAALAKETTLLVSGAVGLYLLTQRDWRAFAWGAAVLAPFVAWQITLYQWLGDFGIGSGGRGATGFEIIPFMGVIRILTEGNLQVFVGLLALLTPIVLLPTLWGLWGVVRDIQTQRWTLYSALMLANAGIMLFVPFSTYREPVGILRFIVGLQLALILYAAERKQGRRRPLRYSTFWALTTLILVVSDVIQAGG